MSEPIRLPAGKYIVAVSGGVDSVVLLDILSKQKDIDLVIAHFDHGIRKNSVLDAQFTAELAGVYKLPYEIGIGNLGPNASEAEAREARYEFLRSVMAKYQAQAVITAHHQDDVIETAMINIVRGTGRSGLTSLKNRNDIARPLLGHSKKALQKYADDNKLKWREDETNTDTKYLRNHLRHAVVAKLSDEDRNKWLELIHAQREINEKLDAEIESVLRRGLHKGQLVLGRQWFCKLPHSISKEVIVYMLVRSGAQDIDKKTVERITVQIKTLPAGKVIQAGGVDIMLTKRSARFKNR